MSERVTIVFRPLVTPGTDAASGLWFPWVRWTLSTGQQGVRSVGGGGWCDWQTAAEQAIRAATELMRDPFWRTS